MESLLAPQLDWIVALQQHATPALDAFFRAFTGFGGRHYLWLVPAVVWCVDRRTGTRVLALMALTLFLNTAIKEWIAQPRPFALDPRIVSDGEQGYGLPSGHAQLVVIFWGMLAARAGRRDFWSLALAVMFLMGVSRVWLGVHFPSDVLAGWALGGLTLAAALRWRAPIEAWLAGLPRPAVLSGAAGLGLLLLDRLLVADEHLLAAGSAGFLAGTGIGAARARCHLAFEGHGAWWRRLLRYLVGMALTLALLGVMRRIGVPQGVGAAPVVFLDLALFAFWLAFAAPRLFVLLRLGDAAPSDGPAAR